MFTVRITVLATKYLFDPLTSNQFRIHHDLRDICFYRKCFTDF